jgi:hypothetical protein
MALEGNALIRVQCQSASHWGDFAGTSLAGVDPVGLHLVRTVERIAAAHITTEHRAGVCSGAVSRLRLTSDGAVEQPVESHDETGMPDEGGRMLRYPLADLEEGIYVAESVGPGNTPRQTYFEVFGGRVTRLFDDRRRATRELRRLSP